MNKPALELRPLQEAAVKAKGKNILVSAGAGTGKTRVLVERFLHIVSSVEAQVTEILALTFTEKAANEMKSRILERCSALGLESARRSLESAYISTLHAFAARILREHPVEAGVDPDFRVLESDEAVFLKDQIFEAVFEEHCGKGTELFDLLRVYGESRIRSGILRVHEAARQAGQTLEEFFAAVPVRNEAAETAAIHQQVLRHFDELQEAEMAEGWKSFVLLQEWNWERVEEFKSWRQGFSRKRGKKGENHWPEIKRLSALFLAIKIEGLSQPWRLRFESLACLFEKAYEVRKKERGFLDFDDLEIRVVRLFKKETPVHRNLRERYRQKFRHILVDEFQDTNPLQLELIHLLASGDNLFFVGDYKQSIYAFRGAEPALFLDREIEHRKEGGAGVFIPLYENFRTSAAVMNFINRFFEELWSEDGLSFEPLMPQVSGPESSGVELWVVRPEEKESLDAARMREADLIAERMLTLHEEGVGFGSMAVLFQAMTNVALYEQALKKRGIPSYVMSGGGFYHQPEVRDIVSYLAFLENPLGDIPLAASLRSPLFQLSDNALFWISHFAKGADKEGSSPTALFRGLEPALMSAELPEGEKKKIQFFRGVTEELFKVKDRLKLTELLDRILSHTSYELTLLADPQGVRRYANLKKLMNLARQFEAFEPLPLGAFLQAVKRMESQQVRESEAQIEAEQSGDAVRLLTVHRAKGLEFEVVFSADLGRERQASDSKTVLAEAGRGYGLQAKNEKTDDWENPAVWLEIEERLDKKDREEWKRLLYVAMTRAKRKLVLSGVYKERKKEKERFSEMGSWMEWLMHSDLEGVQVWDGVKAQPAKRNRSLAEKADLKKLLGDFSSEEIRSLIPEAKRREAGDQAAALFKGLEPLPASPSRIIHLPVSAYAAFAKSPQDYWRAYEIGISDETYEKNSEALPGNAEDENLPSPADFGTAMHRALELLDFRRPDSESLLRVLREAFRALPVSSQEEAGKILADFSRSPLFERLSHARKIYREIPFILNERHGLIHGVIDVLFQDEASRWHVLDYKTAVGSPEKLGASGYEMQIALYAYAVKQILGVEPSSGILYFLRNGWEHKTAWKAEDFDPLQAKIRLEQEKILALGREVLK